MMTNRIARTTKALMITSAAIAIGAPSIALAQQTASGGGVEIGEIVVTARKRAEDVQTVPISISALSAKDLEARNISNLADLSNSTPGVAITSITGGTTVLIYLRGLAPANTANDLNVDGNVGVFIDGIYQTSRNTLDMISVLDPGQIEIAKGPQSALYGRSTFAGAMGITTKGPSHDFSGGFSATAGVDKDFRVKGTVSGPVAENLYGRISAGYVTYDGYGKNAASSDNLGGYEKHAVSGALEWAPTDNFTAKLTGLYTKSAVEASPSSTLSLSKFNCGTTNAATALPTLYCGEVTAPKTSDMSANIPDTRSKNGQLALDMNWDLGWASLVSVSGVTASQNEAYSDYDVTSGGVQFGVCTLGAGCIANPTYTRLAKANLYVGSREKVRTVSQEFRLQSPDSSKLKWMIGGYYFNSMIPLSAGGVGTDSTGLAANERYITVSQLGTPAATGVGAYDFTANIFLAGSGADNQVFGSYTKSATRTKSLFGSVGYEFGKLRVNAEARYNIDSKRAQTFSVVNATSQPYIYVPVDGVNVPGAGVFPVASAPYRKTYKNITPRFSVDYQLAPTIFAYATAAKGIRSGGFNTANAVSATGILASEVSYDEEENWTYEAGFKSRLLDRRLLLNASVFHTDWSNAQVTSYTDNPTALNPVRIVRNAGDIKVDGFELQSDFQATDWFQVGGSVTYSDPKFQKGAYDGSMIVQCVTATGAAANGCQVTTITLASGATRVVPSIEGKRPTRAVKTQWNLHAVGRHDVFDGWTAEGRVDINYTGSMYNNLLNTVKVGERTLTNVRLSLSKDNYNVALWANNLFDKTYVANSINQPRAGYPSVYTIPEIYLGEGRRVGVTLSATY